MSLQYRVRSRYDDEKWRYRNYLCEVLLSNAINDWCLTGNEFPISSVVAKVVHLFSPASDVRDVSAAGLEEYLAANVVDPCDEFLFAWPNRDASGCAKLVGGLTRIVNEAVEILSQNGTLSLSARAITERLADEVVARQFVVFHRYETTSRDNNFHGTG